MRIQYSTFYANFDRSQIRDINSLHKLGNHSFMIFVDTSRQLYGFSTLFATKKESAVYKRNVICFCSLVCEFVVVKNL